MRMGAGGRRRCTARLTTMRRSVFFFHGMHPLPDLPDPEPRGAEEDRTQPRDRATEDERSSHPDAARSALLLSPTAPQPRKNTGRHSRRQNSTLPPENRAALIALGRCRMLSFDQLRRMVFPRLSPQRVGQRLRALAAGGWLIVWEDVSRIGGRPRYALPTRRALTLATDALLHDSIGTAAERVAALLLRGLPRRPLVLPPRATPAFLAHQRECNELLLAATRIPGVRVLWATTLDRPFPLHASGVPLPQPDFVLILERDGRPALVFGEHDRGHESLAHFRRTKAERYAALAARPDLTTELFGFAHFVVWVTVLDVRAGAPLRRLETLVRVARAAAASDVMAFTLAGWAVTSPDAPIWFCDGATPATANLVEAKSRPDLRAVPTHPSNSDMRTPKPLDPRTPCAALPPTCGLSDSAVVH